MKRGIRTGGGALALIAAIVLYSLGMARFGAGVVPVAAPVGQQADAVLVIKSTRQLRLLRDGEIIGQYAISLGADPSGHEQRKGDERTPEGQYSIDRHNTRSRFHLSLHISYPNGDDIGTAQRNAVDPGGDIMIHGLPNGLGFLAPFHRWFDWTNGCIAVTNGEIAEIYAKVPDGTPITIVQDL